MSTVIDIYKERRIQTLVRQMHDQYVRDVDAGHLSQDQRIQALSQMFLRSVEAGEAANSVKEFALERIEHLDQKLTHLEGSVQKIPLIFVAGMACAALGGLLGTVAYRFH